MRVRTLLLLLLFGFGALPVILLTGLSLPTVLATFQDAATREALLKGREQETELNRRLERRKETVRNVAMLPAPLEMLNAHKKDGGGLYLNVQQAQERFTGVVRRWFASSADFRRLVILDPEGAEVLRLEAGDTGIVAAPAPVSLAAEFPDRFAALVAAGPRDPAVALIPATMRLRLTIPIRGLDAGAAAGVLAMEFDLRDVLGYADSLWIDGAGRYVQDASGALAARHGFEDYPELRRAGGVVVTTAGERAAGERGLPMGDAVWTSLRLDATPDNRLWIGTRLDRSGLDAWLAELRMRLLLVAGELTIALALLVRVAATRIDTAKQTMMDGLERILRGERDVAFPWRWPREARRLAEELTALGQQHADATTARREAEDRLFEEKERAEATLLSIADGVVTTDAQGRVRYVNPAAARLLHRSPEEMRGQMADRVLTLLDEGRRMLLPNPAIACLEGAAHADVGSDAVLVRADGGEVAVEASAAPMHDRQGGVGGAVVALRDVTQERRLRRLLAHQAAHDPLTGLMNRRAFEERLKQALADAPEGDGPAQWLSYIDLDQFKMINDTCGHLAGDELLKQVAGELKSGAGDGDALARMGGDEFAVLTRRVSREMAYEGTERLRQRLAELRFAWQAQTFTTSGSFGLVPVRGRSGSLYDLLSAADRACYVAKDRGRNRIHVADTLDEATQQFGGEMRWAHETIRALEQDRLLLYWQPIRPLRPPFDGVHGEILVRMRGADGAIVAPGAFIPAAERYNLMREVDRWIVRHVVAAFDGCAAPHATVALNLSAQSLCDDDFLGFVLATMDASGIDPRILCFEVTETAAMSNLSRARQMIHALKGRGCRFALDDFGSGLSSFGYLKNLPVDYLKIDGSFVRHVAEDRLDRAFVASINDIGHLMGIETIAEYVETPEIEGILREIGVDYAQGYAVGRPMPLEDAFPPVATGKA